ncbi:MAG TPA: methyltransferase domain-containing protein [Patescibacteria group bacterium]|nr:methyltransferase domain-containing protein [Patescibacteria group bacterium]
MAEYYETNKARWNELVEIHAKSEEYDLEGFIAGRNSLHQAELDILGDVTGKSLFHLQCHFGLDTISWARLGARATGVDFSETAIELAREIAKKVGSDAEFVCGNIYDLPQVHEGEYDIVFTSIGVLCWLQEIDRWGSIIAHYLKPGGTFLLVESHPLMWVFDDESKGLRIRYSYWHREEPLTWEQDGSYAAEDAKLENRRSYEWQHSASDVLNSLIKAGLRIKEVKEYPYLPWKYLESAEKGSDGYWRIPGDRLPQMWSVEAVKI